MTSIFYFLAWAGFLVSLAVHLSAILGLHPSMNDFWFLHIGIFVVFIPAITAQKHLRKPGDRPRTFRVDRAPHWMQVGMKVVFIYALFNFAAFMYLNRDGNPELKDGKYVQHVRGQADREITQAEYQSHEAWMTRGFSGHWLLFYFWSAVGLRAKLEKDKSDREQGIMDTRI